MKLHEEFKLYETMWDDPARTYTENTEDETFDLIGKLMNEKYTEDFILECPGFDEYIEILTGDSDPWGGRDTRGGTVHFPDFEYPIEPDELYDFLINLPQKELGKFVKYSEPTEVVNTFVSLQKNYNKPNTELEQKLCLFVAENLDILFKDANYYIYDHYADEAYEWAKYNKDWD